MRHFSYPVAVSAIVLANIGVLSSLYTAQPVLPLLVRDFHISAAVSDLSLSVSSLALAIALLILGPLSDRFGRRRVMVISSAALVFPTVGVALAPNFQVLLVFRALQGACSAGVGSIALAYIIQEFPAKHVGSGLGWGTLSLVASAVAGRVGGGVIAGAWGWRAMFLIFGAFDVVGVACMTLFLPRELRFHPSKGLSTAFRGLTLHMQSVPLLHVNAMGFLVSFSLLAYFAQLSFYLAGAPFRLRTTGLGLVYLVYIVGAFAPAAGKLSSRIGRSRVAALGFLLLGAGCLLSLIQNLPTVIAATALASLGLFIAHTSNNAYVGDLATANRGGATALYMFCYYSGGSVGVFVLGAAWDLRGWTAVIGGCAAASCIGLVLAVNLPPAPERATVPDYDVQPVW